MSQRKWAPLVALVLVALLAVVLVAGCGSSNSGTSASSSPGTQTTAQVWQKILGHAPTGLAQEVLTANQLVVANDANYAPQSSVDKVTKQLVGFDVDVANATGKILGVPIKFVNPNWDRRSRPA